MRAVKKVNIFVSIAVALLVAIGATGVLVYVLRHRIVIFAIDHFTDYRMSCKKWTGNPLGHSVLTGFRLEQKKTGIAISAAKGEMDINGVKLLREGTLVMKCSLTDLDVSSAVSLKAGSPVTRNDIMDIAFSPEHKYKVLFSVYRDDKILKIAGMEAESSFIRIKGDFSLDRTSNRVDIDMTLFFSPEIADRLPENILKDGIDEQGWYSTVIDIQGPLVLLEALYSLAA